MAETTMDEIRYDETLDMISSLRGLEDSYYCKTLKSCGTPPQLEANPNYRAGMIQWYFDIASHCEFQHDTVAVAVSCLDRFLAQHPDTPCDRYISELVGMTIFYTAVKAHELTPITLMQLMILSESDYSRGDFEKMERFILVTLQWRVNPPTALEFIRRILLEENGIISKAIIPNSEDRERIMKIAMDQVKLGLFEDYFTTIESSMVAFAAILNAFETVMQPNHKTLKRVRKTLLVVFEYEHKSKKRELKDIRSRLDELTTTSLEKEEEEQEQHSEEEKEPQISEVKPTHDTNIDLDESLQRDGSLRSVCKW